MVKEDNKLAESNQHQGDGEREAPQDEQSLKESGGSSIGLKNDSKPTVMEATDGKPNIATFRGIPPKLHESVKKTAADLGVSPGELARYLLEVGLKRIEAGEESVEPKFVPGGFTLYPDEGPKRPTRKARKKPKTLQQPRSYYGVPREIVKMVLEKSRAAGVTQGELARYLFERGLAMYKKGELLIEPEPVRQIATLYPDDIG